MFQGTMIDELINTVERVEQKARQTLKVADRAYLLETGRVARADLAAALADDSLISDTFLGQLSGERQGGG